MKVPLAMPPTRTRKGFQNIYTDLTQPTDDATEDIRELYSFIGLHGGRVLHELNLVYADFMNSLAYSVQSRVLQEYVRGALANNVVVVPAAGGGPPIHRLQALSIAVIGLHLLSLVDDFKNVHGDIYVLRSRLQANFVIRRAMECSLMTDTTLHLLLLDWKQAFDSLDHTAMLEALKRLGASTRMLHAIRSIYANPIVYTRGFGDAKAKGKVGAGIRQGCPLSPYLFIIF